MPSSSSSSSSSSGGHTQLFGNDAPVWGNDFASSPAMSWLHGGGASSSSSTASASTGGGGGAGGARGGRAGAARDAVSARTGRGGGEPHRGGGGGAAKRARQALKDRDTAGDEDAVVQASAAGSAASGAVGQHPRAGDGVTASNGTLVAFQVDALNQREEYRDKSLALEDKLQSERISHAVVRARVDTAASRNAVLQRRVAELEQLRQTSKAQVTTLLDEMAVRAQEADQAEAALKRKLAAAEARAAAAEAQTRVAEAAARDQQAADTAAAHSERKGVADRVALLTARNRDLERCVQQTTKQLAAANGKLAKQEAHTRRLQQEADAARGRRELLSSSLVSTSSASAFGGVASSSPPSFSATAEDAALDARVRQLSQEARFNAHLRAQQKRIRDLVGQNKVLVQTQLENDRLTAELEQLEKRRVAAADAAASLETDLRRQQRQQSVWQAQWNRLFGPAGGEGMGQARGGGDDGPGHHQHAPADVATKLMELRTAHVGFQDRIQRLETQLAAKTREADDLEQQVIALEEKQEKLEDDCEARAGCIAKLEAQAREQRIKGELQAAHVQNLLDKLKSMRNASPSKAAAADAAAAAAAETATPAGAASMWGSDAERAGGGDTATLFGFGSSATGPPPQQEKQQAQEDWSDSEL